MGDLVARAEEELSRALIRLLIDEPFFGHLLSGVVRDVVMPLASGSRTATMGISLGSELRLVVNADFFLHGLASREHRVGALKHEALHLLFMHPFRSAGRHDEQEREIFDLACDLVVNQLVAPDLLPDGFVTLDAFDPPLPPDQTAEAYYATLLRRAEPQEVAAPREGTRNDHDAWGASPAAPSPAMQDVLALELVRRIAEAHARTPPNHWARQPPFLRDLVAMRLRRRRPQVDWRRALRIFAASSIRTRVVGTRRRPSKRYAQEGVITGDAARVVEGIKVKRYQELAVVLDTSGSIQRPELETFFSEIHGLWRAGAALTIVEADDQVHRAWTYEGRTPDDVEGGGGNDCDPAFRWLRDDGRRWDGVIFFTDAHVPEPQVRPPCRMLWVVDNGPHDLSHLRWGRAIRMR